MRAGPRPLLITSVILVSLVLLAWISSIAFWQVRLRLAARSCEREAKLTPRGVGPYEIPAGSERILGEAGCRSISHLLEARETSTNPAFTAWSTEFLSFYVARMGERVDSQEVARIFGDGTEPGFRQRLKAWSREHAGRQHPWWAPWAGNCLAN